MPPFEEAFGLPTQEFLETNPERLMNRAPPVPQVVWPGRGNARTPYPQEVPQSVTTRGPTPAPALPPPQAVPPALTNDLIPLDGINDLIPLDASDDLIPLDEPITPPTSSGGIGSDYARSPTPDAQTPPSDAPGHGIGSDYVADPSVPTTETVTPPPPPAGTPPLPLGIGSDHVATQPTAPPTEQPSFLDRAKPWLGTAKTILEMGDPMAPARHLGQAIGGGLADFSKRAYEDFQNATPADKAKPPTDETPNQIVQGFKSGFPQLQKLTGASIEGFGHIVGYEPAIKLGKEWGHEGDEGQKSLEPRVAGFRNIRTDSVGGFLQDVASMAGYTGAQGVVSSAPSLVTGGLVALLTKNPRLSVALGSAPTSFIQNYGDVYSSSKEDEGIAKRITDGEITERQLASAALIPGLAMAALDVWGIDQILGKELAKEAKEALLKRVVKGIASGAITEGSTEGLQEILSQWFQSYMGSQKGPWEQFASVVDNVLGGMFSGGPMKGASAAIPARQPAVTAAANPATPPLTGAGAPPTSVSGVTPPLSSSNAAPSGAPSGAAPSAPTAAPKTAEEASAQLAAKLPPGSGTTTITVNGKTVTVPTSGERPKESAEASEALDWLTKAVTPVIGANGEEQTAPEQPAPTEEKSNYDRAVELVRAENKGSTSYIQRQLGLGYGEAAKLMDQLEANGVVGPPNHAGKREVLPFAKPGTRTAPIEINTDEDVAKLGQVVRQDGSHAQGEANNIQREHADWHGHSFTMEAPAGGTRKGVAPDGTKWEQKFTHPYGYLKGIKGADGQEIDAYMLGAEPQVFVLDELDENGKFRQHKLFLGARDSQQARQAYLGTQNKKAEQWGGGQMMTADEFKEWSKGDLTKPVVTGNRTDLNSRDQQNRTLRAYGYSQFQIDRMSPKNRAAEWEAAVAAGTKPEDFQESDAESAESAESPAKAENVPQESEQKTAVRELDTENTPPVPEPASEHVAAVEDEIRAEGEDPKADYLRGISKRAAGLYAQHQDKGLSYREAGQAAIAEHMINSGFITEEQAREHYGPKLLELLQAEPGGGRSVLNEAQHAPGVGANAAGAKAAEAGSKAGQAAQHGPGVQAHGPGAAETSGHPANGRGDIGANTAAARPVKAAQTESREQDSFALQQEDAVAPPRESREAQYVIPGAERISQAEYLARKAAEPKGPRKRGMRIKSSVKEIETERFARDTGPDNRPPPRPKPPRPPAPMSAMTYLASRGGIQPDSELKKLGIDYKTRVVVPGQGWKNVVSKKNGMTMDHAVEVMMEGKYLPPDNARKPNDFDAHNKIRDMLSEENRKGGVKTYPMGQEDTGEQSRHERTTSGAQLAEYEDEVRQMIAETDSARHITRAAHFIRRAATIMATEGLDVDAAWHAAVMREDIDSFDVAENEIHEVFDLGDLDDLYPRPVQRNGEAPTQDGGQGEGPAEAAEAAGSGERVPGERGPGAQEKPAAEEVKPSTEKTAAGVQTVIPGTEKISKAEEAQRKADKPLKPKVAQKLVMDDGLFGDGHKQLDLVEQAAKAPEATKSEKAPETSTAVAKPETPAGMFLQVGKKRYEIASFKEASEKVSYVRDTLNVGASEIETPVIVDGAGKTIGYVAHNGRVFEGTPQAWNKDTKVLYENRKAEENATVPENKTIEVGRTLHGRPIASNLDQVLLDVEAGKIKQRPDKEGLCYPTAGKAAIDGTYDYVIGLVNFSTGQPVYHGIITTTENGVTYYADPTLTTDAWFPEDVFRKMVNGFVLVHQMHAGEVKSFGQKNKKWPDPKTLGLPSINEVMQHARAGTEIPRSKHPDAGIWAFKAKSPSVKETPSEPAPTSTKTDESAKGDDTWWKELSPHGREMVAEAAKAGKTVAKAAWGKIRPDVQAKLASIRDSDQDPNVIRDAPTWATVLHEAPLRNDDGRPSTNVVFGVIKEVSGKDQPYDKLKPSEKHEVLRRLKEARAEKVKTEDHGGPWPDETTDHMRSRLDRLQGQWDYTEPRKRDSLAAYITAVKAELARREEKAPKVASAPSAPSADNASAMSVDEASRKLEQAWTEYQGIKKKLDKLDERLERKETPRNALDKERIDKNYALTEKFARQERKKAAAAYDAWEDAKADLKKAKAAAQSKPSETITKPPETSPKPSPKPSVATSDEIPDFLLRNPKKPAKAEEKDVASIFDDIFDELDAEQRAAEPASDKSGERPEDQKQEENKTELPPDFELLPPYKTIPNHPPLTVETMKQWRIYAPGGFIVGIGDSQQQAYAGYENWKATQEAKAEIAPEPTPPPKVADYAKRAQAVLETSGDKGRGYHDIEKRVNVRIDVNLTRGTWPKSAEDAIYAAAREQFLRSVADKLSLDAIEDNMMTAATHAAEKGMPEHPGLVIKSLETGKTTTMQPKGTRQPKPKTEAPKWKEVGKNGDGRTLFEDERGVRSYVENGVRITEPVQLRPTKAGTEFSVDRTNKPEWEVVPEKAEKKFEYDKFSTDPAFLAANKLVVDALNGKITVNEAVSKIGGMIRDGKVPEGVARVNLNRLDHTEGQLQAAIQAAPERSATEAAKSAAKNVSQGTSKALDGLMKLFDPKNKMSEGGLTFDDEDWKKAKPFFVEAAHDFRNAWKDIEEFARKLVQALRERGMSIEGLRAMRPYLERFTQDVKDGKIDLAPETSHEVVVPSKSDAYRKYKSVQMAQAGDFPTWTKNGSDASKFASLARAASDEQIAAGARELTDLLWDGVGALSKPGTSLEDSLPLIALIQSERDAYVQEKDRRASESSDERTRTEEVGPGPLDEVPAEQGGGASEGGDAGRSDTVGSGDGTEGNRPSDEHGLPGEQGAGGGAAGPDNAQAGARGGRGGRAGGRAGGNGARVPRKSTAERRDRRPGHDTAPVAPEQAPSLPAINFKITEETALGKGGEVEKFNDNIAAIETLKTIEREHRRATPEEQRTLARYVGWGGIANAFRDPRTQEFKPAWKARGEQLEQALTREEHRAASSSTQYAHYTSKTVIDAMWSAVKRLGFKGGIAIETSAGVGNFLGLVPSDIAGSTRFIAVEKDNISARIAKLLYPEDTVLAAPFQNVPLPDGEATLVIGNPPFSQTSLSFKNKPELTGMSMHNQFILAGLDALKPGGIQVVVVSRYLMDAQNTSAREKMAIKAKLIGAIRLPDTAFKENARTEVVTDILFFQRRTSSEEVQVEKAFKDAREARERYRKGNRATRQEVAAEAAAIQMAKVEGAWIDTDTVRDPLGGADMTVNWYFAMRPDMIMGQLERSGTMQMSTEEGKGINVTLTGDLAPRLAKAIENLPNVGATLHEDVLKESLERHKSMSEALSIALSGSEVGHVERTPDGKLTQITQRETASGEYEMTRREVTPASPWSRELSMAADGRWYAMEPLTQVGQLQRRADELQAQIDGQPDVHDVQRKIAVEKLKDVQQRIAKTNPAELAKDGKRNIYTRKYFENNEVPASMRLGDAKHERLVELVNMRDLMKQQLVFEAEDAPSAVMEGNRKKLAKAYQDYIAKNGLLNESGNTRLANDLPDGQLILALETGYKAPINAARAARTGEKVRPPSALPAPIMSQRVVPTYDPPTTAASVADALSIVLSESGRVDLERVAGLLGTDEAGAAEKLTEGERPLVYLDPETNRYEPRNAYLSGQVAKKLNAARVAGLDKNVADLEKVQPAKWTAENVTAILGSNWIPSAVYEDFAKHLLGTDRATVSYFQATNAFDMLVGEYSREKQDAWGTKDMPADAILRGMLNSKLPKVMTAPDENGNRRVDQELSTLVQLKSREIANEFADWVFRDGARRGQLVDIYNEKFNTRVTRQHDGSHLTLPGKVPDQVISLYRHQKNAIWRGIYERFMLLDHVVGAGKTFTAIARAMERRRMGLSRKPMVAVPNHLVDQWTQDVYRLYPGAKVLAAGKNQFDKKNRRRLFARIATGDWDLVIVPHSSFGFIGVDPATELRFLDNDLRIALEALQEAEENAPEGRRFKPFTVKEAEKLVEKIEGRMESLKRPDQDRMLTFEQLGVDDLTVDEAHEFKNLFYSSNLSDVRGMGDKAGSKKAFDLYNKVRVLRESPTGTVTFMTGTPISNSAVEMFTIMRYLAAQELKDLGLENFDAWRTQTVSAEPAFEPTDAGGLKEVTRLGRSWSNMRSLMELYYTFTDSVSQEDINRQYAEDHDGERFPVPKVKGGGRKEVIVQPTPAQAEALVSIVEGFNGLPGIQDPFERNKTRLKLMDAARKVATDVRLIDRTSKSKEVGGKLDQIADNVARIYKATDADRGTQLIFQDRGVKSAKGDKTIIKAYDELVAKRDAALAANDEEQYRKLTDKLDEFDANEIAELKAAQNGGWNVYDQLKENLIKRGIPADQIRFVQEANNDAEKKALFDLVREGSVRVLIGSTPKMGAGTNVQDRLVALHHGDVTWKPSDIEQREGRIIRQGNDLLKKYGDKFEAEIIAYATERTVDAKMWALNSSKLKMINGIRKYDGSFTMEFEDSDAVGMAEIAALATGDPLMLERVKLMAEIDKIEMLERAHRRKMFGIEDQIHEYERIQKQYPGMIEAGVKKAALLNEGVNEMRERAAKRFVRVEGKTFTSMVDAVKAANEAVELAKGGDENARYSINVDGQRVTSKAAYEEAIENALGDNTGIEVAREDGTTWRRVSQVAKELSTIISATIPKLKGDYNQHAGGKLGTLAGFELNWGVSRGRWGDVASLWIEHNGATFAEAEKTLAKNKTINDLGVQSARSIVTDLVDHIRKEREFDPGYYQRKVVEAGEELPRLRQNYAQATFAQQGDLDQKRARLYEVVQILDARTKAAERARGAHAAQATDEPLGSDTPAASRARGVSAPDNLSEDQQNVIDNITKIVRYIAGPSIELRFSDNIKEANFTGWGSAGSSRTLGLYYRSIVELALNQSNIVSTALHEAYHHIEAVLQNARELALMTSPREMARMRKTVQRAMGFSDKEMNEIAGYEIRALAFEIYGKARIDGNVGKLGLHIGARAFFDKLARIIERVRNMLTGYGFKTAEDVFNKAYTGQYRNQAPVRDAEGWFTRQDRDAPLGDIPAAARAPRRFRPVGAGYQPQLPRPHFTPLHSSVRAAINDPSMPRWERYKAALGALLLPAAREFWDKIIDVIRIQRAAEIFTGSPTPQRLDTVLAATNYPGITGERLKDVTYELFHPIYDAMKEHNVKPEELHDFLYARHAKERNDEVGLIHAPGTQFHNAITNHSIVGGSGMSTDDALDILNRFAARRPDFDAVAALVDSVVTFGRDLMDTEGLEHSRTLLAWANKYQYYVPLKGEEVGSEDEFGTPTAGKGFSIRGPESMRALGRQGRSDDILATLLQQTMNLVIRAEKNKVAKTFARWAIANPNPSLYKIGLGTMRRNINPASGLVELEWLTTPAQSERAFAFKVAGDTHYIEFAKGQEGLLLALKNMGYPQSGKILRALQWFTRTYSAYQTARNPAFVLTNVARDIQDAGIALTAEQQAGFEKAYLKHLTSGRSLLTAVLGQAGATGNRYGQLYEEWRHDGGKISSFSWKDLESYKREINDEMKYRTESMKKKVLMQPLRLINPSSGHIIKLFEALSDITESTTRLAVYAAAREIGLSRAEAARASREMTVDFARGGRQKPILQALYAFSSPAILGPVNLVRRLNKSRNFRWIYGAGIPTTSFMLTLYNLWASPGDDDDKDKKLYEEMKYWEREKNIIIYIPGHKDAIKIPLGFLLKPAWMVGENAAMVMMGKVKPLEGFVNVLGSTAAAFNPFGAEGSALNLAWWIKTLAPTFADPVLELVRNRNWIERPIHPEERPWNSGVPHAEQSKMTTSPYAESTARWLNEMSGGNTFTKGGVDLYPDDIEHVWNFVLGGYGKFMLNSFGYLQDKIDGVDTPIEKLPIINRFVSEGMSDQSRVEKYYDDHKKAYDDTQAIRGAYRARHADSGNEAAQKTIDELFPKTGAHPTGKYRNGVPTVTSPVETNFRNSDTEIKQLRLEERALRRNREMPRNERINALKANRKEQLGIMKGARVDYRELQTP